MIVLTLQHKMDEEQYSALKSKIENVEGSTLTELPQELQPFYKQANNGKWRVAPWYNYTIGKILRRCFVYAWKY